ncbi:hypothetical protein BaRGS_00033077 [Batillaria attramentaria]|uniref:Uncharacterized protein n=1 Tax=Batillaria attramentaria TaxID=370345 RepID=A0ABD0JLV9_9CAEN
MCEVLRSSFEALFPSIEKAIKQADFVAIDTEFTGLVTDGQNRPSLFDTSEERYRKLRNSVTHLSVRQFGLSAFIKDKNSSGYEAHTYNFPLIPASFGPVDSCYIVQASSTEFLCRFNFDFNKCAYEGVPFLNDVQERLLCQSIDSGALFSGLERQFDESFIQSVCSTVAQWYVSSTVGQTLTLHKTHADAKLWNDFVIQTEVRKRFPEVWTMTDSFQNIAVMKVTPERRSELEEKAKVDREEEQEKLKQSLLGFTRVFRVLREYQKPLVGHNMLMDLLFLYDKFFQPLPADYNTFKRNLHDLFPRIYDTKHISFSMRKMLEAITGTFSTNLVQLYRILDSERATISTRFMPKVTHAKGFERYKSQDAPHEAGFDAFLCGYAFVRICHLLRFRDSTLDRGRASSACPFNMYLATMAPFCNRINIIRATINHIKLDGKDPPSLRPEKLIVRCRKRGRRLNIQQLAEWLSPYGTVDVRLLTPQSALVAAGNFSCAKAIMAAFKGHQHILVTKYRFWKHSQTAKIILWGGLLVSGGVCAWAVLSILKNSDS